MFHVIRNKINEIEGTGIMFIMYNRINIKLSTERKKDDDKELFHRYRY